MDESLVNLRALAAIVENQSQGLQAAGYQVKASVFDHGSPNSLQVEIERQGVFVGGIDIVPYLDVVGLVVASTGQDATVDQFFALDNDPVVSIAIIFRELERLLHQ